MKPTKEEMLEKVDVELVFHPDRSMTYRAKDGYEVNVYETIEGSFQLSNKIWEVFVYDLKSVLTQGVIEYMLQADRMCGETRRSPFWTVWGK